MLSMLRYLAWLSLRCFVVLALFAVLISRAWGWSEYASPALYVVYYQLINHRNAYFLINADGKSPGEALVTLEGTRTTVDCSPDGRNFAMLTAQRLVVVTEAGVTESATDREYTTVNVANDGTVALFDASTGWLRIDNSGFDFSSSNGEVHPLDRVDISPEGLVLWNQYFDHIDVVTPDRQQALAHIASGHSGTWMPSAQIFTFYNLETDRDGGAVGGGQYVMDIEHQRTVKVGGWVVSRPLSPDATQVAAALVAKGSSLVQVVVYDLFTNANRRQLTFDPDIASQPICFLAFRPEAVIADSSS